MTFEAKEARNAYAREYRRKNKDKIKEIEERYWKNKYMKLVKNNKVYVPWSEQT